MKWKIVADSGSNLSVFTLSDENVSFQTVPLMLNIGTNVYIDDKNLDKQALLAAMEQETTATSSACPSPSAYAQAFEGAENVICFTITSALSGSYNSAVLGMNLHKENHPDVNVHIFDTKSAGPEEDLLVHKAIELAQSGIEFDDMVNALNDYHARTNLIFVLESVDNLVKNGRLNKLVGGMIGLLGIRLVAIRNAEGTIEIKTKAKGSKRALKSMFAEMENFGYKGGKIIISHGFNPEGAEEFKQLVLASFPQAEISITPFDGLCTFYAQRNGVMVGYEI
ncbi:MAG: DegV family protein [Aerococcaceae bacterium]|nr:DegV family protein [Aerococcaceae bacterium]